MYAISHAATALVIKKKYKKTQMIWLLISVQLMEILWVVFNYLGIEHITLENGVIHLGYLPFSHSIATGLGLTFLTWLVVAKVLKQPELGIALSIGVVSHLILDIIQHEADITIAPFITGPAIGLGLSMIPLLDFAIETAYGVLCWWFFKGSKWLLAVIIIFNVLDIPLMLHTQLPSNVTLGQADFLVTTIVAIQIVLTWAAVWVMTRKQVTQKSSNVPALVVSGK